MLRHAHRSTNTLDGRQSEEDHRAAQDPRQQVPDLPEHLGPQRRRGSSYAKKFNDISARAKESGMFVGYHSHASDFKKFDGKTAWEIFFDNTKPDVIHQLDTGNTLDGGGDPLALIKKYPGRTKTTHLKEHGGGRDAPIGEGKVDWKALLRSLRIRRRHRVVHRRTRNQPRPDEGRQAMPRQPPRDGEVTIEVENS